MQFYVILVVLIAILIEHINYSIKQSNYFERKQDDQRKFNPIRETVWWRK